MIPVLKSVLNVTANVLPVPEPQTIVSLVKVPELLILNQLVAVKITNSLTILANVKLVVSDVLLVLMNILVILVLISELLLMNVHVHKDIMKSITKLSVNNVLHNVLNVKSKLTTVSFVLLTESNLHQNAHVHPEKSISSDVLIVTSDVLNVPVLPPIVILVPKTESMPQLVSVQMVISKSLIKDYVHLVKTNVKNVSLPLITV